MQRRRFLERVIQAILSAIGGALAFILGGAVVSPTLARRRDGWILAAKIDDLPDEVPMPVTVSVPREDGYRRAFDRQVVFLLKTGPDVRALSAICTHLGCLVRWDPDARLLKCPCHGGVYGPSGDVRAGPPPRALSTLATRTEGDKIFVRL